MTTSGLIAAAMGICGTAAASANRSCEEIYVPVPTASVPDAVMYGELCRPDTGYWPSKVQFLVHGGTQNHHTYDFLLHRDTNSHVQLSLDAGWATFNVDMVGNGKSTIPLSTDVNVDGTVDSLHQVAQRLRNGSLAPDVPAFDEVVYTGTSLSVAYGWQLGASYPNDFDGFVLTGLVHGTSPDYLNLVNQYMVSANTEPLFQSLQLDPGYVTTARGAREIMFFNEGYSAPGVVNLEEVQKGFTSGPVLFETAYRYFIAPEPCASTSNPSPSCAITKPVYFMIGEFDKSNCDANTGFPIAHCTSASVLDFEDDYFAAGADLAAYVQPNSGHVLFLHEGYETSHAWLMSEMAADGL